MSKPAREKHVDVQVGPVTVKLWEDDRIAQSILSGKPFEPKTLAFFAEHVAPATRVLDIGCYSGLFSIAAVKLGARPIGFEPFPDNQSQIFENQKLNGVKFPVATYAVSDKEGNARLGYNEKVHLTSGASLERKSGPGLAVSTVSLDHYVKQLPDTMPISMIKMDVERHEPAVIRGARLTIEAHKPMLIVEANDAEMTTRCVKLMVELDYNWLATLDERNLIFSPRG